MTTRIAQLESELSEIDARFRELEDEQLELVQEHLPIGSVIKYSRGNSDCDGTVIEHSHYSGNRVYIRGTTGARYWIDVHRIVSIDWVPDPTRS